jgi:hypothetical protein
MIGNDVVGGACRTNRFYFVVVAFDVPPLERRLTRRSQARASMSVPTCLELYSCKFGSTNDHALTATASSDYTR